MEAAVATLEQRELESGPDGIHVEGYTELLAYYLLQGELCNAKYLWKRVPSSMKQQSLEIQELWNAGKCLWTKDLPGFYKSLGSFKWSPAIAPIIVQLTESIRERTIRLIGTAYTSIRPEDVSKMLGLSLPEVEQVVNARGWKIVNQMIEPTECPEDDVPMSSGEAQIGKLTDFVSFLEN